LQLFQSRTISQIERRLATLTVRIGVMREKNRPL